MHEETFFSSWLRKDGIERRRMLETDKETKAERSEKRRREGEKEENEARSVKRRCVGCVSVEAFDIFSQG